MAAIASERNGPHFVQRCSDLERTLGMYLTLGLNMRACNQPWPKPHDWVYYDRQRGWSFVIGQAGSPRVRPEEPSTDLTTDQDIYIIVERVEAPRIRSALQAFHAWVQQDDDDGIMFQDRDKNRIHLEFGEVPELDYSP